jgi:ribosomal protein L7/L12
MSISSEAKKEVERYLLRGQKIEAVKYLRDSFGVTLEEAKILVDTLEGQLNVPNDSQQSDSPDHSSEQDTALDGPLKAKVISLLQVNQKIVAVKEVKEALGVSLKEALQLVDEVQQAVQPDFKASQFTSNATRTGATIFKLIFGLIGVTFMLIAVVIYYNQSQTISTSDRVTGHVIDFVYSDGGSAPIIEYPWQGTTKLYRSTTYSTPPAYDQDEEVTVFVNRNDADDAIVDTFSDRWFVIFIFGLIGFIFTAITTGVIFAGRSFKPKTA